MHASDPAKRTAARIAVALPSEGTELESTRAMLQERIGLWTLWVAILSSGFYVIDFASLPLSPERMTVVDLLTDRGPVLHLIASLIFAGTALLMRAVPFALRTLRVLDLVVLVGGCAIYAWMGVAIGRMHEMHGMPGGTNFGIYAGLLACTHVVMSRAVLVPHTAVRTFWSSVTAMAPLSVSAWGATHDLANMINIATWSAVTIAVATVGSRVIFGLRHEAARVRRLGQYTLEEKIGAGGMGVVYRARHAMLRRPTAIKLLPPDRAGEANLVRFEREVQLTSQLSHPNTIAIYDYGRTPDGIFYYAMEYLEGINLEELVRREGPLPAGRVIAILRQVCGALGEAHSRGLLHRDVKPANIILTERGGEPDVAKVVDFGLVKPFADTAADITLSSSMVLAGTPLYMAPEALTAPGSEDARSDLYALGAVGYFLLTAQPVFEAATVAEAFAHHLHSQPVPPSKRGNRVIPVDLEALMMRCLEKLPANRPATAADLGRALAQCAIASPWTTEQATAWWRAFRASVDQRSPQPSSDPSEAVTVTVDLAQRATTS